MSATFVMIGLGRATRQFAQMPEDTGSPGARCYRWNLAHISDINPKMNPKTQTDP
jgi:hypothetical protein